MINLYRIHTLRVIDQTPKVMSDTEKQILIDKYKKSIALYHITVKYQNGAFIIVGNFEIYYATIALGLSLISVEIENDIDEVANAILLRVKKEVLNPMMSAFLYSEIMEIGNMKQSQIAEKVNKTQGAISNKLRLLKLPLYVQEKILNDEIKERHGRALLQLIQVDNYDIVASKLAYKIVQENMKVVDLEDVVDKLLGKKLKIRDALYITPIENRSDLKNPANGMIIEKIDQEIIKTTDDIKKLFPLLDLEIVHGVDGEDYVFILKLKGLNNG